MCSHYQALKKRDQLEKYFRARGIPLPEKWDMWPRYLGVFVRRPPEHDSGDEAVPEREALAGRWGMIAPGTPREKLPAAEKLSTFNARGESADKLWTYRNAWAKAQRCIIPAEAVFEPDWRSGKAVPTRVSRADGAPMGIAGLWDRYRDADGAWQVSYTMLTINAADDPIFGVLHKPDDEKRSVVILPDGAYGDWLTAPPADTRDFLRLYPASSLVAEAVQK